MQKYILVTILLIVTQISCPANEQTTLIQEIRENTQTTIPTQPQQNDNFEPAFKYGIAGATVSGVSVCLWPIVPMIYQSSQALGIASSVGLSLTTIFGLGSLTYSAVKAARTCKNSNSNSQDV